MRYRIENIAIPEIKGIAGTDDESLSLNGRRIIAVIDTGTPTGAGSVSLRVLTEEVMSGQNADLWLNV